MNTKASDNGAGRRSDCAPHHGRHRPAGPRTGSRGRLARVGGAFGALAASLLLAACGTSATDYQIPPEAMTARPSSVLAVGDVIRVSYPGAPELNLVQKIAVNGQVSLPTVGSVTAAGRTVGSLQSQLTKMYEPHLQVPDVMVSLETPAAAVYVSGEVNRPGKVPLDRSMTALEAVMESGGFSKLANPKQVFVIRNEKGRQRRYVINLADTLAGAESQAFYLRPYDTVYIKKSNW